MYVCGNSDFVIDFDFDAEWNEYEYKTARFITQDGLYTDVVFSGAQCAMPVLQNTHRIHVGVFAGNMHTTTPAYIPAKKSILCGTDAPATPPEDAYAQMMEDINQNADRAEAAAAEAERIAGTVDNTNIFNGEAEGSLRTANAAEETADYKLGKNAFAGGHVSKASGNQALAFGDNAVASGVYASAFGQNTTASEWGAFASGIGANASAMGSHAEGNDTIAKGKHSHAEGYHTIAAGFAQHVQGQYNVEDTEDKYAHIVGWGLSENSRRNLHTITKGGDAYFDGDIECGMVSGSGDGFQIAGLILHGTDLLSRYRLTIDENEQLKITKLED